MAQRKPFADTLGAAWLLFLGGAVVLVVSAVAAGWLTAQMGTLGWLVWVSFVQGSLTLVLGVRLLVRLIK